MWSRIVNLLMGVLLLITLSYSIPSVPRQRSISQTEWIKIAKEDKSKGSNSLKSFQSNSITIHEFVFRILNFNKRTQVSFKLSKSLQFIFSPARFAPAKIFSNDDDYFLS